MCRDDAGLDSDTAGRSIRAVQPIIRPHNRRQYSEKKDRIAGALPQAK